MPAQEHTCKNRKTCLLFTAVSWGPYLLPSPQPAKGKYSVNLAIPAAHLSFPAKLHPMRQVQEVSKKAERPTGCPAFCYITSFCSIYSIWHFSITIYPGYSDTCCTSPGRHAGCIAAQALSRCRTHPSASSAPMVRTIPLARAARSSAWLAIHERLEQQTAGKCAPRLPGRCCQGQQTPGVAHTTTLRKHTCALGQSRSGKENFLPPPVRYSR